MLIAMLMAAVGMTACDDSEPLSPLANDEPEASVALSVSSSATSTIVSQHASNMCLDSDGGSANIRTCDGSSSQQFTFASDGTIRVNGKCLATSTSSGREGEPVTYASCTGASNQRWTRTSRNEIRGINGYCLDIAGALRTYGAAVIVWTCHTGTNQKWTVNTTADPAPAPAGSRVRSLHASNMCLDSDGGPANIRTCDGTSSQQFTFASDGTVRVNGKCLATATTSGREGEAVTYASCTGASNQRWTRTSRSEIRGINGYCLDIGGALRTYGAAVIVWTCHTGTNQKWEVSTSSGSPTPPPPPPPTSGGGADHRGRILFTEPFDNGSLGSRGWYDYDSPRITTSQRAPGSSASFECRFARGATECTGGVPGRHQFDAVEQLYISYWVKFQDGWVGSGKPYHPHEFHILNNLEGRYAAPAYTRLTLYVEHVNGRPRVALQDGANVDNTCILRNDNKIIGCSGYSVNSYPFGEDRSVAACNGLVGPVDGRDCYSLGNGRWYSMRNWKSSRAIDDGNWHFVETYMKMNTISSGRGNANGIIRVWVDGQRTLDVSGVLFRTGEHPTMKINQVLFAPYIGDGSPIDQTVWYDQLTFAEGRLP